MIKNIFVSAFYSDYTPINNLKYSFTIKSYCTLVDFHLFGLDMQSGFYCDPNFLSLLYL